MNNVINITYIEQKIEKKVVIHKIVKADSPEEAAKAEGATVEVFQPPAAAAAELPRRARRGKKVEEVAETSQTKEQAGEEPATDNLVVPAAELAPAATTTALRRSGGARPKCGGRR